MPYIHHVIRREELEMTNTNAIVDRPAVGETNGLVNGAAYHAQFSRQRKVYWTHPGLKITRLRLLSDPGYPEWDVSYCHGYVGEEAVHVELPFSYLTKGKWAGEVIAAAKKDGVNAKRLGLFDAVSKLC
jgi:hypothetical protein